MDHVSLYRKHRSQTFAEVVGQDHITTTLANAVAEDRLHHAYLFTGPRGTGKTSTARILAKAVNCEQGPTATPCNTCEQCVGITTGSSVDVIEIDAASHGGVDDVRDLRDRVAYAPASARMKVYIVDECHMLSTAGWNAFLKTVEEPPGHVLFVFATTEPHKVLPTILSRTQRFDFRRIAAPVLAEHCRGVAEAEGITLEPGALDMIVRAGDGSARDTLSVLEQVVAFAGREVSVRAVVDVLGSVGAERLHELTDLLAARDVPGLVALIGKLADAGQDLRQLARDIVEHLRRLFLMQTAPDADLVEGTPEQLERLREQAGRLGQVELLRAIELVAEAQAQMRRGHVRLPLELALCKAALPEACGDPAALASRLDRLERLQRQPQPEPPPEPIPPQPDPQPTPVPDPDPQPAPIPDPEPRPAPIPDPEPQPAPIPDPEPQPDLQPQPDPEPQPQPGPGPQPQPGPGPQPQPGPGPQPDPEPQPMAAAADRERAAEPAARPDPAPASPVSSDGETGAADAEAANREAGHTADPGPTVDLDLIRSSWPAVLEQAKERSRRYHAFLAAGQPAALQSGELVLEFGPSSAFHAEQVASDEWRETLPVILNTVLGVSVRVRCVVSDGHGSAEPAEGEDADGEVAEVLDAEAAEAAGELPDEEEAHAAALERLTRDLGARVVDE